MYPRNQQPLAKTAGQQFHSIGDPRRAAGQHNDAVSGSLGLDLGAPQLREKSDKADRSADKHHGQRGYDRRAQRSSPRSNRRARRSIVGIQTHATLAIPPFKSRTFSDKVE